MIQWLYGGSQADSSVSVAIISISVILMSGFLMTRITKKLRLPNVTAYIVAGILIGPYCLNIVPKSIISGTSFLSDIALAFIAFSTGQFFKFDILKKNGAKVICIALFEALLASVLVFILTFFILRLNLAFSIVLAALASATAPASIMMTIRQTGAKGDFVETLLQVIAIDNILSLLAYSVAISIALNSFSGQAFSMAKIFTPVAINLAVLFLGVIFGIILKLMIQPKTRSSDNRLIISIALLFAFCGICTIFEISPLLGCMSMGTVYLNMSGDEKLFKQLNYFSPPFLLMFFVRSGMSFNLPALVNTNSSIGDYSLLLIGILYFITRIFGKYGGAFLGSVLTKKNRETRTYLGLALVPQAGVAIGLAALGARTLKGEVGNALETIILASSVLYELIGPACAKVSLYLSKSYSNKLEDLVEVSEQTPDGKEKTQLELLIDRIQKIQTELPVHTINEDEEAFTEAAEQSNTGFRSEIQKKNLREPVRKRSKK
ncbi:cation:proton antiporter [Treponema ruminis]|uniref:Kef-type K+ transport system membrane component KefB n=1 Tax=Treponema ruminis TaxID=744515 RepID=A0A7W8G8K3_9SPIR|nr:cation:proton antiporter [Treponema ruminis]MBB5225864.1 Kef-type K+ transport system membrane component KefB [Treponema ruminis]QSI02551.1 cation:proton antiporter [Treponema ruminis]